VALTYVLTQQTTHPALNLLENLKAAGFAIVSVHLNRLGSFGEFVVQKSTGTPS